MKRKFEQEKEDEFYTPTPLIEAIETYNLILDDVNDCKTYITPENENDVNFEIEEDKKLLFDSLENERLLALTNIHELLRQGQNPDIPREKISYRGDYVFRKQISYYFPLHLAKDKDLIEL